MGWLLFNSKANADTYQNALISAARSLYVANGYKVNEITGDIMPKEHLSRETVRNAQGSSKWADVIQDVNNKWFIPDPEDTFGPFIQNFNTQFRNQTGINFTRQEDMPEAKPIG